MFASDFHGPGYSMLLSESLQLLMGLLVIFANVLAELFDFSKSAGTPDFAVIISLKSGQSWADSFSATTEIIAPCTGRLNPES